jgi:3-hydroxyacyl-[acyl-carrier-protein] dehydratase
MKVTDVLQHRYPMLMIDKVLDFKYMEYSIARKNVTNNEPWAQGHYPGAPIFPGVLMIETMAQASTFMFVDKDKTDGPKKYGFLAMVDRVKFIKPVFPGDVLELNCTLDEYVGGYAKVKVVASVDGKKAATGLLSFVIREGEL